MRSIPEIETAASLPGGITANLRQDFAKFAGQVVLAAGWRRINLTMLLLLLAGATEGVGLMLLLPLLRLGMDGSKTPDALNSLLTRNLKSLGLPLSLPTLLGLMMVVIACRSAVEWGRDMMATNVQLRFAAALRKRTITAVAGASWSYLGKQTNAHLHSVLCRDIDALRQSVMYSLLFLVQAVLLLTNAAVAIAISPPLALLALVFGVGLVAMARRLVRYARACGRHFERHQRRMHSDVADFINGLKLVKSMGVEHKHVDAFNVSSDGLHGATRNFKRSGATLRAVLQLCAAGAVCALLLIGQNGRYLPFAEMVVLTLVFVRVVPVLREVYQGLQIIANAMPAYLEIELVIDECLSHAEASPAALPPTLPPIFLRQQLQLHAVSYRYRPGAPAALLDINATLEAGSIVALVGPSGAGKTTLADIVLGLLAPDSGQITVDGILLRSDEVRAWRRSVGYVPQEPFFLNGSIRDNLSWTCPSASEADMMAALAQAHALQFVQRRARGLDALIGDHGRELSGGERQRLALARALLRKPSVLVLDEPTSALDPDSASLVYRAIDQLRGTMTVLIIAHDLDNVRAADLVLVLDHGRLVEQGKWRELAFTTGGGRH